MWSTHAYSPGRTTQDDDDDDDGSDGLDVEAISIISAHIHHIHLMPNLPPQDDDDDDDGSDGLDVEVPESTGSARLDELNRRQHAGMLRCIRDPVWTEQVSEECADFVMMVGMERKAG